MTSAPQAFQESQRTSYDETNKDMPYSGGVPIGRSIRADVLRVRANPASSGPGLENFSQYVFQASLGPTTPAEKSHVILNRGTRVDSHSHYWLKKAPIEHRRHRRFTGRSEVCSVQCSTAFTWFSFRRATGLCLGPCSNAFVNADHN
jgi:hypothetical protein